MTPPHRPPTPQPSPTTEDASLDPWDFDLPPDAIATRPAPDRPSARLMLLPRDGGPVQHHRFTDLLHLLRPGDLLVGNDTRVMPCRLVAHRATGGRVELLLLEPGPGPVRALVRPLKRLAPGETLHLEGGATATLQDRFADGQALLAFDRDPLELMEAAGEMPLPPYIERPADASDRQRYQTVFAGPPGAAAAPTAGLHFDAPLLQRLKAQGVGFCTLTLHVGLGTFRPLRPDDLARGALHAERYLISPQTVDRIARVRAEGGRIIAIGTTTARTLESATPPGSHLPEPGPGETTLFIRPPYHFRSLDGLITNFHLPRTSLLMLVASLVDRPRLLSAYDQAIQHGYRFYSYGDAMLLL